MAYTGVNKSTSYFNVKNYSGNGSAGHALTGVGFQPDWTWIKRTDAANSHSIFDAVRGVTKNIVSNSTAAESTNANGLTAFGTDGFTVGTDGDVNNGSGGYTSWNWKAGTTSGIATNGSTTITPTAYSFNQTAGFSIIKYNGSGSNALIPHGLGVAPKVIIIKQLNYGTEHWGVYHASIGNTKTLYLNRDVDQYGASNMWNDTSPDTVNFSVGTNDIVNNNNADYIAYCFADKTGYCKAGRYDGIGNSDGNFIYLGFKPTYFLVKRYDADGGGWTIKDGTNSGAILSASNTPNFCNPNETDHPKANVNNVNNKASAFGMDFVSNGVKIRGDDGGINTNGADYVYLAMGQTLVGTNNIPCNAR